MNPEVHRDVRRIVELLSEVYTQTGVETWLYSANRNLDNQTPAALINSGRVAAVLAEAEQLCSKKTAVAEGG